MKKLSLFLFILGCLFRLAGLCPDALADPIIQPLIDAAPDGGTVSVPAGTFSETLTVDKNLTLQGVSGAATILQPGAAGQRVITVTAGHNLTLRDLTLTGGHLTGDVGGGVHVAGGSLTLTGVHITNNSADYGGGVFQEGANGRLDVTGGLIEGNTATYHGGGLYVRGSALLTNTAVNANSAGSHGGGMHVNDGSTEISGGTFSGNQAGTGNGGAVNVNNALNITGTQFSGNTAGDSGGAVTQWNIPVAVTISGAAFTDNTAYNMGGGAYIRGGLTLTNSTFTGNQVDSLTSGANVYGGGLYAQSQLSVDGAVFTGNQAKCNFCNFNEGGGLYSSLGTGPVSVTNSMFDGNKGWFGGAIFGTTLNVTRSTFKNAATGGYGGGIEAVTLQGDYLLFQDNSVINDGGAVAATNLTLNHTRFIHNTAGHWGGAVKNYGTFTGSNLLFTETNASGNGDVIHLKANATASLYNATIAQPTQGIGPAVYLEEGAVLTLYNSIVTNYTNAIQLGGTGSTLNEDYNLFYHNGADVIVGSGAIYNSGGHSTGLIPPGFVNPATGDYHLTSASQAVGAGYNFGLTDDLDGRPRLAGRNDVGAYQFRAGLYLPLIFR